MSASLSFQIIGICALFRKYPEKALSDVTAVIPKLNENVSEKVLNLFQNSYNIGQKTRRYEDE
jgi:hypothetical protein